VRFWESNGGAGPRATPTLSGGRFTRLRDRPLNVLDASNGAPVWSRDVASDANKKVPCGVSSSLLVLDDRRRRRFRKLAARDIAPGSLDGLDRIVRPATSHRATIDGIDQILPLTVAGATSVAPRMAPCSGNIRGRRAPRSATSPDGRRRRPD
jgi:hypothetical protein